METVLQDIRLPGLDGMLPGGNVKGREKTTLEELDEVSKVILKECSVYPLGWVDVDLSVSDTCYKRMYGKAEKILKDIEFDALDIDSYIFSRINIDLDPIDETNRGMFTGCLLEILTKRRRKQGLGTRFYINGHGAKFPYLFLFAKHVDELVVDGFKGSSVCSFVGSYNGSANLVAAVNCAGNSLDRVGYQGGDCGIILAVKDSSPNLGRKICSAGNAGLIITTECLGGLMHHGTASFGGKVDLYIASKNSCNTDFDSGNEGYIGVAIINDNFGSHIATNLLNEGSASELVVIANNHEFQDIPFGKQIGYGRDHLCLIRKMVFYNNEGFVDKGGCKAVDKVTDETAAKHEYEQANKTYRFQEFVSLAQSLKNAGDKGSAWRIIDQIQAIFGSLRGKLDENREKHAFYIDKDYYKPAP